MCMSPSSLGNCTIYSTCNWCIMICLVIPILCLLLFIQSLFTCLLSFFDCCHRPNPNTLILLQRLVVIRNERVNKTIVVHYASQEQNLLFHCVCSLLQAALIPMYVYVHVHACTYVLHYGYIGEDRTERVNEDILLGRKPTSMHYCKFISSCTIMYVMTRIIMYCGADTHQN